MTESVDNLKIMERTRDSDKLTPKITGIFDIHLNPSIVDTIDQVVGRFVVVEFGHHVITRLSSALKILSSCETMCVSPQAVQPLASPTI